VSFGAAAIGSIVLDTMVDKNERYWITLIRSVNRNLRLQFDEK